MPKFHTDINGVVVTCDAKYKVCPRSKDPLSIHVSATTLEEASAKVTELIEREHRGQLMSVVTKAPPAGYVGLSADDPIEVDEEWSSLSADEDHDDDDWEDDLEWDSEDHDLVEDMDRKRRVLNSRIDAAFVRGDMIPNEMLQRWEDLKREIRSSDGEDYELADEVDDFEQDLNDILGH